MVEGQVESRHCLGSVDRLAVVQHTSRSHQKVELVETLTAAKHDQPVRVQMSLVLVVPVDRTGSRHHLADTSKDGHFEG